MKHGGSQHPYGIRASAARAALRFATRRNATGQYDAWRPVALFWRRQRNRTQSVRVGHGVPAGGAVWLPQFHLHFVTCVHDRPWRGAMPGSLSGVTMYQRRVVMAYEKTIVQSSLAVAQPRREQRPEPGFAIRHAGSGSGASVRATAPYVNSARRRTVPPIAPQARERDQRPGYGLTLRSARTGSGASVQAATLYTNSARRFVVPPPTIWEIGRAQRIARVFSLPNGGGSEANAQPEVPHAAPARRPSSPAAAWGVARAKRLVRVFSRSNTRDDLGTSAQAPAAYMRSARRPSVAPTATWAVDAPHYPKLGQPHVKVRPGTDAAAQALPTFRMPKREPLVFRLSATAGGDAAPPYAQARIVAQPSFHPQELLWRRAVPPAAEIAGSERYGDAGEGRQPPLDRSFPEPAANSGMAHPFGPAPVPPALKIDAALMDRLADDVIRRVERRARIDRERQGL